MLACERFSLPFALQKSKLQRMYSRISVHRSTGSHSMGEDYGETTRSDDGLRRRQQPPLVLAEHSMMDNTS